MKENTNIDELFRKGTEHHYPFDEGLWAAVEGQLPPQPVKPLLWIFNLNSMALVFMLFVCAIIPTDNTRAVKPNMRIDNTNTAETKVPSTSDEKILSNEPKETKTEQTTQKKNESLLVEQKVLEEEPLAKASLTELKSKNVEETVKSSTSNAKISIAKTATSTPNKILNQKTIPLLDEKKKSQFVVNALLNEESRKETISSLLQGNTKKGIIPNQKLDFIHSLDFMPFHSSLVGAPISATTLGKRQIPKKSSYFELEVMQDISIQKTLASSNQDLQQLKQDNEKSISQSLIGLNFIKQHKSFIYGLGIHHSKYTERVSYTVDEESLGYDIRYDTNYRLVSGNYNSNGVPVLLINREINEVRSPTTVIVDGEVVSINTFKRIGIPVFVGVQQNYRNWVAELRTSLSLNYLYQSEGVYLTEDLNQVESINSGAQLKSMIVGNKNDLSIGYAFHEQFAIGTRYSLYNDLSSFTSGYESRMTNQSVGVWILWKPE